MDNVPQKTRRIWRVVLVISLALNIAVAGVLTGTALSGRGKDGPPARMTFAFGPLGRILDGKDRRAISEQMRRNGPRPLTRGQMNRRLATLADALRADPFDPAGFAVMLDGLRDRTMQVQENAQGAFVAHLAGLTPERRAALADRLERKR